MGSAEAPLRQPSWSAVNTRAPSKKTPLKSYSVEWDFEWLNVLGKEKDQTLSGGVDNVLTDGVDWVSCDLCSNFFKKN